MRRNSFDVTVDILETARTGAKKTRIVYGSNLNFDIVKGYLKNLIDNGLLAFDERGRYVTTRKGVKFVEDYRTLVKSFD
jgi:predicted transcriptional regulator